MYIPDARKKPASFAQKIARPEQIMTYIGVLVIVVFEAAEDREDT